VFICHETFFHKFRIVAKFHALPEDVAVNGYGMFSNNYSLSWRMVIQSIELMRANLCQIKSLSIGG